MAGGRVSDTPNARNPDGEKIACRSAEEGAKHDHLPAAEPAVVCRCIDGSKTVVFGSHVGQFVGGDQPARGAAEVDAVVAVPVEAGTPVVGERHACGRTDGGDPPG